MGLINTFLLTCFLISFYTNITVTCLRKLDNHGESRSFIGFGTHTATERPCTCNTTTSCSCCQIVKILYTFKPKTLCFNMIYRANVLNVDLSLDMLIMNSMTVANYRPFQMCAKIPDVLFSNACVTITDVRAFPGSAVTVCPRMELSTKKEKWTIPYTCSTLMPNGTAGMMGMMGMMMGIMPRPGMPGVQTPGLPGTAAMGVMPAAPAMMPAVAPARLVAPAPGAPAAPPAMPPAMRPAAPPAMVPAAPAAPAVSPMPSTALTAPRPPAPAAGAMPATPPAAARPPAPAATGAMPAAPPAAARPPAPAMGAMPPAPTVGAMPPAPTMGAMPPAPTMGATPPAPAAGATPPAPATGAVRPPAPPVAAASTIVPRIGGSPMLMVMMNQDLASALESAMTDASASFAMAQENYGYVPESRFDPEITLYENQADLPIDDEQFSIDLRNNPENYDQNLKEENRTQNEKELKTLKRKKRNYDIFDILHQSNRCERAYRICITRSKHFVVSRLRNPKQNIQVKNGDCGEKFVKIVHEPDGNLCTQLNLNDDTTASQVTQPPLESHDAITYTDDSLSAIIIQDEPSEGSDFHPQDNLYPIPSMTYVKEEMYPSRIPPVLLKEDLSRNLNDSALRENLNSDKSSVSC